MFLCLGGFLSSFLDSRAVFPAFIWFEGIPRSWAEGSPFVVTSSTIASSVRCSASVIVVLFGMSKSAFVAFHTGVLLIEDAWLVSHVFVGFTSVPSSFLIDWSYFLSLGFPVVISVVSWFLSGWFIFLSCC